MKEAAKRILKAIHLYHPLQSFYRDVLRYGKRAALRRRYRPYRGSGFTCNYCHVSHQRFAPWHPPAADKAAIDDYRVIAGYGENILCPYCLSTARERLLKAMLETRFSIRHTRILHLSPEAPVYDFIKDQADIVAADLMPGFYKSIARAVQFADATRLSLADASFDMVIANHIMEHIPDDEAAMREIARVLKPGGAAILQVPFSVSIPATLEERNIHDPARQSALFGQADHVRIYQLDDYLHRLRGAGFIVDYLPYESLHSFYRYAIQPGEGFMLIRKPAAGNAMEHASAG